MHVAIRPHTLGAVGPRTWHPHAYGAYARDLDGNKLAVYCLKPE